MGSILNLTGIKDHESIQKYYQRWIYVHVPGIEFPISNNKRRRKLKTKRLRLAPQRESKTMIRRRKNEPLTLLIERQMARGLAEKMDKEYFYGINKSSVEI